MANDQDPITRAILREELAVLADNLRLEFRAIHQRLAEIERKLNPPQ
jgi:tetrahydromethanopterin S-methyltransferase subunit G